MEYVSVQEIALEWKMSKRRIQVLCKEGRIPGARMIGNMWVLPKKINKPFDARRKNPIYVEKQINVSALRTDLKKLLKYMYERAKEINIPETEQRNYVLTCLSTGLVMRYVPEARENGMDCLRMIYNEVGTGEFIKQAFDLLAPVHEYIEKYKNDVEIDSIVSWAYQYSNKIQSKTIYSSTQFFTEKYMIRYLVSQIEDLNSATKIVDPCCGGGNFLLECFEIMCKDTTQDAITEHVLCVAKKLYGYDIDETIARIAVVNLKIKAISILYNYAQEINVSIWNQIKPNIYVSVSDCVGGSLECKENENKVVNIVTNRKKTLLKALGNADVIVTNPPFATVKGMDAKLKKFLKENYHLSNCDTCAAFLLAIYKFLNKNGQCGIVTQNTWMHLKSFTHYRNDVFKRYSIKSVVNLGSGAFCDLSGEKANVALLVMRKGVSDIEKKELLYIDLSEKTMKEKKQILEFENYKYVPVPLIDAGNGNVEFGFSGNCAIQEICANVDNYSSVAVPMQGTSTGNAKKLIDYFWKHFGDDKWCLVSKGGGYCRWKGLNYSVVKWGEAGEYVRETKGSALRNVKYFPDTNMVYSDTGTAGLNVREIIPNQIFVASGPGIRIKEGNAYAQLAYLNSRIATFYMRKLSPKLTISAGYIGQLPICEKIYNSIVLEKNAKLCVELKQKFLQTRPINFEYDDEYLRLYKGDIEKCAMEWFRFDLKNELLKLEIESQIDSYILECLDFSDEEKRVIEESVGECAYNIQEEKRIDVQKFDAYLANLLDDACTLKRTKVSKNGMGNDGILEYVSKDLQVNPEWLVKFIITNTNNMKNVIEKYRDLLLHNEVLKQMEYNTKKGIDCDKKLTKDIISNITEKYLVAIDLDVWMNNTFIIIHESIFKKNPVLEVKEDAIRKVSF